MGGLTWAVILDAAVKLFPSILSIFGIGGNKQAEATQKASETVIKKQQDMANAEANGPHTSADVDDKLLTGKF